MRVDELEETLDAPRARGPPAEVHLHDPDLPEPGRRDDVAAAPAQRLVEVARERELIVLEDNPYGMLRYEGDPLPTLLELDGGHFVVYAGTFSKILSPGLRLGWAVAPRPVLAKLNLAAQAADAVPVLVHAALRQRVLPDRATGSATWTSCASSTAAGATRCSTRSRSTSRPRRRWTRPQGGLFVWATLPGLPRHDRPAGARAVAQRRVRARARRVPRRARRLVDAAELLRLGRGGDPRGRAADRRPRPRAGRAVRHADRHRRRRRPRRARARDRAARPGRRARAAAPPQRDERGATRDERRAARRRAQGRPLARAAGVAGVRQRGSSMRSSGSATP